MPPSPSPPTKKLHWTQTPKGRAKRSVLLTKQWENPDYRAAQTLISRQARKRSAERDPGKKLIQLAHHRELRAVGVWANAWSPERRAAQSKKLKDLWGLTWLPEMDEVIYSAVAAAQITDLTPGWEAVAKTIGVSVVQLRARRKALNLPIRFRGKLPEQRKDTDVALATILY